MANRIFQIYAKDFLPRIKIRIEQIRHGHHLRGKPPMIARTLKQRLDSLNRKDPELSFKVNIGFAVPNPSKDVKEIWWTKRKAVRLDPEMERRSRNKSLFVDLNYVKEGWLETNSPFHIRRIADHYGIFQHLFGDAYFAPVVPLEINYNLGDDKSVRVYTGNVIKPKEACEPPVVKYKAQTGSLWTLVMCTPDGNMQNSDNEYCHWFLGNIPENKLECGERIMDYLRPIPVRGVGYYRYVFVLYKQTQRIDYTEYKKNQPWYLDNFYKQNKQLYPFLSSLNYIVYIHRSLQLNERNWSTLEFYRKHQDQLTPAGLAFYQSDWDPTVTEFYHLALDTKEPIFQYDFPKPYTTPQTWFPLKQAFNLYMDRYRDPKQIMKEYLLRKFKNVHPFKEPKPPLKYPNAYAFKKDVPSWLKTEMRKERLGWGRVNEMK